jgi:hypothetical protein
MREKPPVPVSRDFENDDRREQELRDFISSALQLTPPGGDDTVLLVAGSADSPVARAVIGLSEQLAAGGAGAHLLFATPITIEQLRSQHIAADLKHEVRVARSPRLVEGHEQLIIAGHSMWFGDDMRRNPRRRNALSSYHSQAHEETRIARRIYANLWATAERVYRCDGIRTPFTHSSDATPMSGDISQLEASTTRANGPTSARH